MLLSTAGSLMAASADLHVSFQAFAAPCFTWTEGAWLALQEDAEAPTVGTQPDWIESHSTCQHLQAHDMYGHLLATEHLAALYLGWRPPSAVQACSLTAIAIKRSLLSSFHAALDGDRMGDCSALLHDCAFGSNGMDS